MPDRRIYNPAVTTSNNRLSTTDNYAFDAAGNVITDAEGKTFKYDGENKQVEAKNSGSTTLGIYYFDGDGKRIKKVVPGTGETTIFVYDAAGKLVAEYSTIIQPTATAKIQYLTNDHLGTPRINTDAIGNTVSRSDYMPFGEEVVGLGGRTSSDKYVTDDVRQGFTGYERDAETALDYAKARMYASTLARMTSPDPLLSSGRPDNPQSWNRYPISLNRPTVLTDPTGLYVCGKSLSQADCDSFEAARLKAEQNLASIAKKYKDKGGINSKEYKKAERAILSYGKKGESNGVTIVKSGSERGSARPGDIKSKAITVTLMSDSFDSAKEPNLDAIIIHEGSHVADISDWYKGGRKENSRFSQYNSEFEAYSVSSIYAEAIGQERSGYVIRAPQPYTRFLWSAVIWDESWAPADIETMRSKEIDYLLRYDKNYLNGGKDKQILPNVPERRKRR